MITINDIQSAHNRIRPFIHNTAVLTSTSLNNISESSLYFKCENFQKSGSFKIRGVANALLQVHKDHSSKGFVTASSGNHGAALSMVATYLGCNSTIVMPSNAPEIKIQNVKRNGGEIIWCKPNQNSRDQILQKTLDETGGILIHPYNDYRIIAGQATAALELIEKYKDLDMLVAPLGGGGLLSGTISSVKQINPRIQVYGAEPYQADDGYRSIISGRIQENLTTDTVCDGLRAQIGIIPFSIIKENVDAILRLKEDQIIEAMRFAWECLKIIIEPSCAITLAAILHNKQIFRGKKIGLIITGGNVDLDNLPW